MAIFSFIELQLYRSSKFRVSNISEDVLSFDTSTQIDKDWFSSTTYIPDSYGNWQETNPNGFNEEITNANQKYNNIVKPIVRLLKYWNSSNGKPYASFKIETMIANMNFSGDNYQSGFFYAIDQLSTSGEPDYVKKKVDTLRNNKDWVVEYLNRGNEVKAKERLHKILP